MGTNDQAGKRTGLAVHVLILRYTGSVEKADPYVSAHVEYLRRNYEAGTFLLSGQTQPTEIGGAILTAGVDRAEAERIAATDPFVTAGVGRYEIITITPDRVHPMLRDLLELPSVADIGWDQEALGRLQSGESVVSLLMARPITPVLQHAGRALLVDLANRTLGAGEYAQRCARGLDERSWTGDEQLALELRHALGEPVSAGEYGIPAWPLELVPVEMDELADHLEGDPLRGQGVLDLQTGQVWPPGVTDYDPPSELDRLRRGPVAVLLSRIRRGLPRHARLHRPGRQ
jgi:uncharacterized protein YciI